MLISLSLIILVGLSLSFLLKLLRLPSLIGYLVTGIILGPFVLNLIDPNILDISTELRQIAMVIILFRAGLMLNISDLKKIGRPAILMSFLPALVELVAIFVLAPIFFGISYLDAFILGSVLAAVSPAVIVPRMIKMIEEGRGAKKGLPQLILAGASVDDIFVIVLFTALIGLASTGEFSALSILNIPLSIILGVGVGVGFGLLLILIFKKIHMRDTIKVLIILGISFGYMALEKVITPYVAFSGLLAIMATGVTVASGYDLLARRLSGKFNKLWVMAEIILFVMVGAAVDITYFLANFGLGLGLIIAALIVRFGGVFVCLIKTPFNFKERLFAGISYMPKATVQAAIGGIPLAIGLASGQLILSLAVVAILITAPAGAILIDNLKKHLVALDLTTSP
ncbi:MAG: cation:proton antiporter [Bacilli bacterium]|nr:cation:proton antiporter [Bacilli bacterium]